MYTKMLFTNESDFPLYGHHNPSYSVLVEKKYKVLIIIRTQYLQKLKFWRDHVVRLF